MALLTDADTDLLGRRYGTLTVISKLPNRNSIRYYQCLCDCGKTAAIRHNRLKSIISCGCKRYTTNKKYTNLLGHIYNRYTVLGFDNTKLGGYWFCQCLCGTTKSVKASNLVLGNTKSCGCWQREISAINMRKNLPAKSGKENAHYDHTRTHERKVQEGKRNITGYQSWVRKIKLKSNNLCFICNSNIKLVAHHLYNYRDNPERVLDLDNGVCLCRKCHQAFHTVYGLRHNTKEQFEGFFIKRAYSSIGRASFLQNEGCEFKSL